MIICPSELRLCSKSLLSTPCCLLRLPDDILLLVAEHLSVPDVLSLQRTCWRIYRFTETRLLWVTLAGTIRQRRAIPLPQWRTIESLDSKELKNAVLHATRIEANFLSERPRPRSIFQVIHTGRQWGPIGWLGQVPGGQYIVIFFRGGMLSVWDVTSEKSGCVAKIQTFMNNYTHTCEVLEEEKATLIGLATGAHDDEDAEPGLGQYAVFKISFPPATPDVSITRVFAAKIDIPITGLFLESGLAGVVGPFHDRNTAALQLYDWRTHQGVLLDTGIDLQTSCDLDVISFPEEIVLYAEDSKQSLFHTYGIENIRSKMSLPARSGLSTAEGESPSHLYDATLSSSSQDTIPSDNGNSPTTKCIFMPPERSKTREVKDEGVGTFGAGYTMLRKCHLGAHNYTLYGGKISVLTMSVRELEGSIPIVRCLTHHFLARLTSTRSPSPDITPSPSTYLSANSSLPSLGDALDEAALKHTFAHTLGNTITKGPTGYDLISFGIGGTNVVWLSQNGSTTIDSEDYDDLEDYEVDKPQHVFYVATFSTPPDPHIKTVRRLRIPRIINPNLVAALDLDDTQGVLCIATIRGEVFRLRFD